MNDVDALVTAVERMRRLQKAYFQNRSKQHLALAKEAEKEVDQLCAEYWDFKQPSLFTDRK